MLFVVVVVVSLKEYGVDFFCKNVLFLFRLDALDVLVPRVWQLLSFLPVSVSVVVCGSQEINFTIAFLYNSSDGLQFFIQNNVFLVLYILLVFAVQNNVVSLLVFYQ